MSKKWIISGIIIVLIVIAFLVWLFVESSKPLPGTKIDDLGRGHVQIGTEVTYNSNPPTSGKHYGDWVRAGVYDSERDDRNLVHSLEHGYVIMHYKCSEHSENSENQTISESDSQKEATSGSLVSSDQSGTPSPSVPTESGYLFSEVCKVRRDQLAKIYDSKGKHKLIVVPRPNLDTNFALTAWTYLDKFNDFDQSRIEKFIDAHIEQGPEHTMEP